jgi:hypothetical protein
LAICISAIIIEEPIRIVIHYGIACDIAIEVQTPCQPNGVGLEVAAGLGIVMAEVVVHQPSFLVEILAGKAQVVIELCAIPVRVFVR